MRFDDYYKVGISARVCLFKRDNCVECCNPLAS